MVTRSRTLKALILVGGTGSRLQPITFTTPKPLIPFINKPMLEHQIEALTSAGVYDIVLAMNYKYRHIISAVESFAERYKARIIFSLENEPLGTAGPISLARGYLEDCTFFVLNSDIICRFPFLSLLDFHKRRGMLGTILSTTVEDPKKFGVIRTKNGSCTVEEFVEKPQKYVGNRINAGIYVFECEVLEYFESKPSSIEKEVFPALALMKQLSVYDLNGFWMDVGTPEGYLEAQRLYLENDNEKSLKLGKNVKTGYQSEIGNHVILGNNVSVGRNSILNNCVVFDNTKIGDGVTIRNSVIGKGCSIKGEGILIDSSIIGDKTKIDIVLKESY